jgi:hypothetical protein
MLLFTSVRILLDRSWYYRLGSSVIELNNGNYIERLNSKSPYGAGRRGKQLGRRRLLDPEKLDMAHDLIAKGKGRAVVARMIGVDPSTLRRALNGTHRCAD